MFSFALLCLHIMLSKIFGSSEGAARDVAERKAVLSLQRNVEGNGPCLASEHLQ